mmetsp:Transcript_58425/g.107858  ORF Transcript_58425/g.107858 Transcript_58425/m.107858 type:complete len:201 (-) Transcript_58425:41-643(-)
MLVEHLRGLPSQQATPDTSEVAAHDEPYQPRIGRMRSPSSWASFLPRIPEASLHADFTEVSSVPRTRTSFIRCYFDAECEPHVQCKKGVYGHPPWSPHCVIKEDDVDTGYGKAYPSGENVGPDCTKGPEVCTAVDQGHGGMLKCIRGTCSWDWEHELHREANNIDHEVGRDASFPTLIGVSPWKTIVFPDLGSSFEMPTA